LQLRFAEQQRKSSATALINIKRAVISTVVGASISAAKLKKE
jgi:hypothetical protein